MISATPRLLKSLTRSMPRRTRRNLRHRFDCLAGRSIRGISFAPTESTTPCYCPGTLILTSQGEVPVETLAIGDKVTTKSGDARAIKWIGRRSYSGRFAMGRKDILPICIKAGALDDNVPRRDLWISPLHAMYFNDEHPGGVLIEARDLVNGVSVVQAERVEKVEMSTSSLTPTTCSSPRRVVRKLHRRRQPLHVPQCARIPRDVS